MSFHRPVLVGILWALSLVALYQWSVLAQVHDGPNLTQMTVLDRPTVVAGPDVGFKVDRYERDGKPVGRLVVRVDGRWQEARQQP